MFRFVRKKSFVLFGLLLVAFLRIDFSSKIHAGAKAKRPNFILVLADDLGYGDLACYGHKVIKTPNLDAFAKKGLRLTSCYASHANCSPSRAGLMTGRTPTRIGITNWIPMLSPMHLRDSEITIAKLLQQAGYVTCHVGKWHLNGMFNLTGPQPDDHGFDHWFSTQNNCLPNHKNPYNFVRNDIPVGPIKGYASHIVVEEAIRWLDKERDKSKPFFMYVCFHEPHEPIASAKKFTDMYPYPENPSKSAHHGNVTQMDDAFGQLMRYLETSGLDENTIILFTSDNGPAITSIHPHGSAGPLRAKKGHMYEGGIRVPGIIYWKGHTRSGKTSNEPVCGIDVLPTFCEIAGVDAPKDRVIDGTSFVPIFEGKKINRTKPLYWHFNGARSKVKVVLRSGDYVLLAQLTGPEQKPGGSIRAEDQKALKEAELTKFELYDLSKDIGQTKDLAESEPERLRSMIKEMTKHYHEVREASPIWPEWEFARVESGRIEWPPYRKRKKKSGK